MVAWGGGRAEATERVSRLVCSYAHAAGQVMLETLWPTRCAVCDAPGEVLCESCRRAFPFIDQWQSCPLCGAPYGSMQCTECNPFSLRDTGWSRFPFSCCVSAVSFTDATARIVRLHKDAGERRLAACMAYSIACAIPPGWIVDGSVVSFVPASETARRRRGFDHAQSIAFETAAYVGLPCEKLLTAPRSRDQRKLSRIGRFANMNGRFEVCRGNSGTPMPKTVLLVDDVFTTGATLAAATDALTASGISCVKCATFARVY
jgi:predicted amidophosphoribosyltransferase